MKELAGCYEVGDVVLEFVLLFCRVIVFGGLWLCVRLSLAWPYHAVPG